MSAQANPAEKQYAIELDVVWETHIGNPDRARPGQWEAQRAEVREANAKIELLNAFQDIAQPIASQWERKSHSSNRQLRHHFDGGIDTTHIMSVVAACAGAVPLIQIIKASRDVLIAWFKRSGISVKLGDGRSVKVRNISELDQVLQRLESLKHTNEAQRDTKAPAATEPETRKVKGAKKKPTAKAKAKKKSKR